MAHHFGSAERGEIAIAVLAAQQSAIEKEKRHCRSDKTASRNNGGRDI